MSDYALITAVLGQADAGTSLWEDVGRVGWLDALVRLNLWAT
jgi:hypothetical protein